ncbi:hypothetical protein [Cyclobacterium plantarum]|uniref:Alpha/beta hydrolase n=1 Tax=Cyclobacterium plantarum TaxID=2716263 RepID=A0ABX0H1U3_9BACT|nr:hypothetical protein [Cyclobacterium plantarum]NHE55390.1 hypothetical protein [Cyclobacterium plantarum]
MPRHLFLSVLLLCLSCKVANKNSMMAQNPSPMEEYIRPHERVDGSGFEGKKIPLTGIFEKDPLLLMGNATSRDSVNLLIHFHGSENVVAHAVDENEGWVAVAVNLGNGSSAYGAPLASPETFDSLLLAVKNLVTKPIRKIYLSGFSAGYGAVRAILKTRNYELIAGVLLLDGLHASYVPAQTPMANGGQIDEEDLAVFKKLAADAVMGSKIFVFTHSSIFPGTFVSTTECADYLLEATGTRRKPVLREGPVGMQQLAVSTQGKFKILAFAGNTAPDHIDHLHGLFHFVRLFSHPH